MNHKHLVLLVVVMLIALAPISKARADMAPPDPPAGGSLDAGEPSTYVQMVSEDVLMTANDDNMDVKAIFNMCNQGTTEETLNVRFPLGIDVWVDNAVLSGIGVDSFTVYVEGTKVDFAEVHKPDEFYGWATWQMTFPVRQTVRVEVSYQATPARDVSSAFFRYWYILETGAGWYGTIEEGTITVRMPYEIDDYNLYHKGFDWFFPTPDYYTIAGTDITWRFTDLEPKEADNISVALMKPPLWREWQAAKTAVEEDPDAVNAHLRLAYAMSKIADHAGGNYYGIFEFAEKAMQEYAFWLNVIPDEYVLQVIPNIVDYHFDYLDLLESAIFFSDGESISVATCQEVIRVSSIAPADKRVLALKDSLEGCLNATTPYPISTLYSPPGCDPKAGRCPPPTATLTITPRSTWTPSPTLTPRPIQTPTVAPTPTPNPQPPTPNLTIGTLAAIAAVVIAGAGIGMWAARRKAGSAGERRDIL